MVNVAYGVSYPPLERYKVANKNTVSGGDWHSSIAAALEDFQQFEENDFNRCLERGRVRALTACSKRIYKEQSPASIARYYNNKPNLIRQSADKYNEVRDKDGKLIDSTISSSVSSDFMIRMRLYCLPGANLVQTKISDTHYSAECRSPKVCNAPYVLSSDGQFCNLYCEDGARATEGRSCAPEPKNENCNSSSGHPIRFIEGNKVRDESVIQTSGRNPIFFNFKYNNLGNHEKTFLGRIANPSRGSQILHSKPSLDLNDYRVKFNKHGISFNEVSENQYYGGANRYWRHNFDDHIVIRNGNIVIHMADGQTFEVDSLGDVPGLPNYYFVSQEDGTYRLSHKKKNKYKIFDSDGRLMQVVEVNKIIDLIYNGDKLVKVESEDGNWLEFEYYLDDENFSVYSAQENLSKSYISRVSSNDGRKVDVIWGHRYFGQSDGYRLITRITDPYTIFPNTARDYSYLDTRWPTSMTNIYTVSDIDKQSRLPYAEFKYDNKGRAIYSSLAGGVEAVTVNYTNDLTRKVTNALGKDATYTFALINGVKNLKKVVGEPTSSCLRSEVEYFYNNDGTKLEKHQNGKVTRYTQYDSKKRELQRIEAYGTADARTITTEWHPTLNLKTKVTGPKNTTVWEYFSNGKLKSTDIYSSMN